jgi:hypothetical protein
MSPLPKRSRGSVLAIVLPVAALGAIATALVLANTTTTMTKATSVRHRLTAKEVRQWVVRAGLDPKALVVAGVSAAQAPTVVSGAADYLVQNQIAMEQADHALAEARRAARPLEQKARNAQLSDQEQASLQTARAAVAAAEAQVNTHVAGVFASAAANLGQDVRASIQSVQRNRGRGVPLEFTLADRADADWATLRDAVSAREIAHRDGRQTPGGAASIIASASSVASTAAAARLGAGLPALQTAWEQAIRAAEGR